MYSLQLPQNPNFVPYTYYEGLFLPHEISQIVSYWKSDERREATLSGERTQDETLRKSSVIFLPSGGEYNWIYEKLAMVAQQCNFQRFGFDLIGFAQELQLTEYAEGDFFEWHMDFGGGEISNRKLSLTVQLSDPEDYEGGSLQFMINDKIVDAPRTKGTIVVFPSFIMHRVTRITRGIRRSIVGWVSGVPYR
ncbi:MAG: 2OG-Fe(II) oxygenase [Candidatus Kapaibacterium sp.]